jgi:hypothetical protein
MEGHPRATVIIPRGSSVTVVNGPLDGERMVDINWNGKVLMVFTQDLRDRAEIVNEQA